jgi:hypothetical protein
MGTCPDAVKRLIERFDLEAKKRTVGIKKNREAFYQLGRISTTDRPTPSISGCWRVARISLAASCVALAQKDPFASGRPRVGVYQDIPTAD